MNSKVWSVFLGLLPIVTVVVLISGLLAASIVVLVLGIVLPSLISTFNYLQHKNQKQAEQI